MSKFGEPSDAIKLPTYGAAESQNPLGDGAFASKRILKESKYPRIDVLIMNLFVPPLLFTIFVWTLSAEIRYTNPALIINLVVVVGVITVLCMWFTLFIADRMRSLGLLITIAVIMGGICGEINYKYNMQPVYVMKAMTERNNVNPKEQAGDSVIDTGKIWFVPGTTVDVAKGMSYKSEGTNYCVAPITYGGEVLSRYDYWAVGINCCDTDKPLFTRCSNSKSSSQAAGLRLMFPEQYGDFHLAVSQAESAYDIQASDKPLFFYWVSDPNAESAKFVLDGVRARVVWCLSFFLYSVVVSPLITFCVK